MTFSLYNRFRQLEKVKIDSAALPGYLGAASDDGVLRTGSNLSYTDGGNYITLDIPSTATPTLAGLSLTGELDITKATTLLVDLNPGFTGTGEVINITPSTNYAAEDVHWDGIVIDGDIFKTDPGAANIGAHIHGIHLDFSTVDMTREPHIDALHILVPQTSHIERTHCLHTNHGFLMESDYTTLVASMSPTLLNVISDDEGSTGGDAHILDVARTNGGDATICAIGTHTGVDVIHQHVGTATAFDQVWEYSGESWIDAKAACASADTDLTLWDAQDDIVYFGHATTFDEIVCIWATAATKSMHFQFHYSITGDAWTRFYPTDDTNGGQISGAFRFLASDLAGWVNTHTINETADKYWIRVTRTRLSGTAPTEDTVKFIKGTSYEWTKIGTVSCADLTTTGTTTIDTALTGVLRGDSGVVSVDTDVTDLVTKIIVLKCVDDATAPTVTDTLGHVTIPIELNGYDLVSVGAHVYTASDSGGVALHIYNLTQTDDMLSTGLTIDQDGVDSKDAGTPAVIDTTGDDVATGDVLQIHVTDIGSATTRGMEVRMGFRKP